MFGMSAPSLVRWGRPGPPIAPPGLTPDRWRLRIVETHGGAQTFVTGLLLRTAYGGAALTGTAFASSEADSLSLADYAFDADQNTYWANAISDPNGHVGLQAASPQTVVEFAFRYPTVEGAYTDGSLRRFVLEASHNGVVWWPLYTSGIETVWAPGEQRTFEVPGVPAWATAAPALRSFVTANYNQPNPHNQAVMASPPTVTAVAGAVAEIVTTYSHAAAEVLCTGGWVHVASGIRHFPCATQSASGGSIPGLPGVNGVAWRATTVVNASKVWIQINGSGGTRYRFIVDGRYVDLTGTLSNNAASPRYFLLDFGSKAARTVSIESVQHLGFIAFCVGAGDSCSAPQAAKRMIVLGDSITQGSVAGSQADGYACVLGDMLGFRDLWASGIADTGYVSTSSGTRYALTQRLSDVNGRGPWDVIVVAMGTNDQWQTGVQAAAETCLASIRSNNPAAQIFVLGPWDRYAPSAVDPAFTTTKSAIQAAVSGVGGEAAGVRFVDTQGVAYANSDGLHPTTAGHKTLGDWLALQIKNALGA